MFIQNLNLRHKLGMGKLYEADDGGGKEGDSNEGDETDKDTSTFDDFLKESDNKNEFDNRIKKALEDAKNKWETDKAVELENAKTEAEKLAAMNEKQKAEYEEKKKLDELAKREKDITTRELKAAAYETLAEKGIPKELVEILNYESAETCNTSIEAVEKAFQSAVQKAVNEKLRGGKPPKDGSNNNSLQEQIAKAIRGQI